MINYEPASDEHKVKDLGSLNGVSKIPLVSNNESCVYVFIILIQTQLTFIMFCISLTQKYFSFLLRKD